MIGSLIAGLLFTAAAMFILTRVAPVLGLVDKPGGRKAHLYPTPVVGGIAVAIGVCATGLPTMVPLSVFLVLAVAAIVGALDDSFNISKLFRLLTQAVVAVVVVSASEIAAPGWMVATLGTSLAGALNTAIAIVLVVALINAVNWIDGVDGLLGSMIFLIALSLMGGFGSQSLVAWAVVGSVGAFLAFNLRAFRRQRAKVFLGDAGSYFLGGLMAFVVLRTAGEQGVAPLLLLIAAFAVPLGDMLYVVVMRTQRRQAPWDCDRTHVHHRLLDKGLEVNKIVLLLSSLNALVFLSVAVSQGLIAFMNAMAIWILTVTVLALVLNLVKPAYRSAFEQSLVVCRGLLSNASLRSTGVIGTPASREDG